jgi:putative ABC transport system permease protein
MKQYWALLHMNVVGIPMRWGLVLTIVVGVGCAVGVLVSMLAVGAGAQREAMGNVRPDRAVVLSLGAQGDFQSSIPQDTAILIRELPGIRRNAQGKPVAVSQVLVYVQARDTNTGEKIGFALTGVSPGFTDYAPELHVTSGRLFRPGLRELIASNVCVRQYADFARGDKRTMRGGEWEVVGNFNMGKTEGMCQVFADADVLRSAFNHDTYNQVNVMLESPQTFTKLANEIKANPTMHVEVKHEADLTEESMQGLNGMLNFVSYFVGSIMAVAATLGAANSLYAVVDGRRRELATLRALGFRASPIIASVLSESILLAIPGALLGAAVAWILFNGLTASPFGYSFHLAVTPPIVGTGVVWALAIGVVGGLLPALRAVRVPVTTALRAT